MAINPWEVSGSIDYKKLIEQFGTEEIKEEHLKKFEKYVGEIHFLLRRKVFFSHRDLGMLFQSLEQGKKKFYLYTGRAPSENTHLGHLIPWLLVKWMQDKFRVDLYFQISDEEKFLAKQNLSFEDVQKYAQENILDVIALGFDKKKTKIIVNTKHASKLYGLAVRFAKHITLSTAKAVFGFQNSSNIGIIFYTAMQAVPAILKAYEEQDNEWFSIIPMGIDQDPHFRVARDVMPKLGYRKPVCLHSKFLMGLKGPGTKMSASDPYSTIFTTDSLEVAKKKLMRSYSGGQKTVKEHREKGGNPDVDFSFQLLRVLLEPDDKKLRELEEKYRQGELLSGELKQLTWEKLERFLTKHQEAREKAKDKVEDYLYKM